MRERHTLITDLDTFTVSLHANLPLVIESPVVAPLLERAPRSAGAARAHARVARDSWEFSPRMQLGGNHAGGAPATRRSAAQVPAVPVRLNCSSARVTRTRTRCEERRQRHSTSTAITTASNHVRVRVRPVRPHSAARVGLVERYHHALLDRPRVQVEIAPAQPVLARELNTNLGKNVVKNQKII